MKVSVKVQTARTTPVSHARGHGSLRVSLDSPHIGYDNRVFRRKKNRRRIIINVLNFFFPRLTILVAGVVVSRRQVGSSGGSSEARLRHFDHVHIVARRHFVSGAPSLPSPPCRRRNSLTHDSLTAFRNGTRLIVGATLDRSHVNRADGRLVGYRDEGPARAPLGHLSDDFDDTLRRRGPRARLSRENTKKMSASASLT